MKITSITIDLEKKILLINGEPVTKPTIVRLPTDYGWYDEMYFNAEALPEAVDFITVTHEKSNRLPL